MKKIFLFAVLTFIIISCNSEDDSNNNCPVPTSFQTISEDLNSAVVRWSGPNENISTFTIEVGEVGFSLGTGTQSQFSEENANLTGLQPSTIYEYYVRSNCGNGSISAFAGPSSFTTRETCYQVSNSNITSVTNSTAHFYWSENSNNSFVDFYEIEYGESGFTVGNGNIVTVQGNIDFLNVINLADNTSYDIYIRTNCGDLYSEYPEVIQFITDPICLAPTSFWVSNAYSDRVYLAWTCLEPTVQLEYGPVGFIIGTGIIRNFTGQNSILEGLTPNTVYEGFLRANCGSDGFSEYTDNLVFATTD